MWLMSFRRQGILTQGPAPDRKCKLNISSFPTLPHLSDCLIFTRSFVSIVFLLEMVGDGIGGGGWFTRGCGRGDRGWVFCFSSCFVLFFFISLVLLLFVLPCPLSFCLKRLEHDSCCVYFFVFYSIFFSLVPLTRSYWSMEFVVSVL